MKANELMIGDWVSYCGTPIKVENVYEDCINFQHDIPFVQEEFLIEQTEVEPIPLTTDILEKIGFGTQPNVGYIIDDWDGTQIIYDSWNHNLRIIKNYKTCLDIETFNDVAVHELQHALKLCGIEKEIAL